MRAISLTGLPKPEPIASVEAHLLGGAGRSEPTQMSIGADMSQWAAAADRIAAAFMQLGDAAGRSGIVMDQAVESLQALNGTLRRKGEHVGFDTAEIDGFQ